MLLSLCEINGHQRDKEKNTKTKENIMIIGKTVDQITVQPVDIFLLPPHSSVCFSLFSLNSLFLHLSFVCPTRHSHTAHIITREENDEILSWCEWISSFDYFPSHSRSFVFIETQFDFVGYMQKMYGLIASFTYYNVDQFIRVCFALFFPTHFVVTIFKQTHIFLNIIFNFIFFV